MITSKARIKLWSEVPSCDDSAWESEYKKREGELVEVVVGSGRTEEATCLNCHKVERVTFIETVNGELIDVRVLDIDEGIA